MTCRKLRNKSFAESSALSDLAFLLIIYFLVIAGFTVNRGLLMALPARGDARTAPAGKIVSFEMNDAGAIYYDDTEIAPRFVERVIRAENEKNPDATVTLAVAPAAPWEAVVRFVELAQKVGCPTFSFSLAEGDV